MFALCHIAIHTIILDEVPSTNDYAIDLLAKSNPIEGTVISTYNQTKGRGQIGRSWYSGEAENLSFSIILRPIHVPVIDSFYLNMILAIAVREAVQEMVNPKVFIKWPNDIIVEDRKIAGLLIQQNLFKNQVSSCVMGVGVNVNQQSFPTELPNPISVAQLTKEPCNLEELLYRIIELVFYNYELIKSGSELVVKKTYLNYLYKRGSVSIFNVDEKVVSGEIIGVEKSGKLVINFGGQLKSYSLNEIKMVF